ncbi:hypothetical protein FFT88_23745 [Escherichia sp. E4930]|nr:hypothetical protein CRG96_02375 [Escherichia sp. E4930]TLU76964.1 hypothetical protein FFT88_23745 [Escherichia sp. E4930]
MRFLDVFLVVKNLVYAVKGWCFCHLQTTTDEHAGGFWHKESLSRNLTGQYVSRGWNKNTWQ